MTKEHWAMSHSALISVFSSLSDFNFSTTYFETYPSFYIEFNISSFFNVMTSE